MSFGKLIGSYLVDIIKAEKNKDYDMCKDCVIEFYTKKVRDKE